MNNSLKLSYDMLFENGSCLDEAETAAVSEPEIFTPEGMKHRLQERDRQWEKRLQQERVEAESQGYDEGLNKGKTEAQAEFEKRFSSIKEMMEKMDTQFNEVLEKLKPHMAGLVFEITEKVLDVPFLHPEIHERVHDEVLQLVEKLDEQLHIKVSVAGEDYEMIQKAFEKNGSMDHFTLRVDEEHKPGEYVVETKKETIIKNFKKMIIDFKESVSFNETDALKLET